ncbi:MAG: phosphonate metabolism protein/1,5-bisphosphokinase (PRPP-forming) PhnN [Rhodobacteraceae bacterium]|nr:phosphonate metabolism protein/1,5-bisphosphokinase (PRPP-forming) PhnN [Paracoccaceae bacterium]
MSRNIHPRPHDMSGKMIAIVGPSGVGKDSVMSGLCRANKNFLLVQRAITRAPDPLGENHISLSEKEFENAKKAGQFVLDWKAHGLSYGIPFNSISALHKGQDMLINLSRNVLEEAHAVFDNFVVINLSASKDVLRQRLLARGREDDKDIEKRIERNVLALPPDLNVHSVNNDHLIDQTINNIIEYLDK